MSKTQITLCSLTMIPIIIICILCCIRINFGEKTFTGYIYSVEDSFWDRTNAHIRFSENAGTDAQPSFCVKKSESSELRELAGTSKKVRVTIPVGVAFNLPMNCAIPAEVEVIE